MLKIITNDAAFFCPVCKGRILSRDSINVIPTVRRLAGATFYCPSCEMFVTPAAITTDPNPDVPC
jgi:C4-type Zn-finger protein